MVGTDGLGLILPDVNVLVYAYRTDAPRHSDFRFWLEGVAQAPAPFALSDLVLSGVIRVVTHPRIFKKPTPVGDILGELARLRSRPNCVAIAPGPRHWSIFNDLLSRAEARGNLVPDAYYAALAIESGSEWITTDRDFARFPDLPWRHPLDPPR